MDPFVRIDVDVDGLSRIGPSLDPLTTRFLAVDLDAPGLVAPALRAVAGSDAILVGVAHGEPDPALVDALDLTFAPAATRAAVIAVPDPRAALDALSVAIAANPQASRVLARLLRSTAGMPVAAALDAESFAYSTLLGGREFAAWLARRGERPFPPVAAAPVLVAREDDQLRVTLNRPERRNAYGREVRDALVAALQIAAFDDSVARVLLDGTGPVFCAGGDLDEFGTTPDLVTAHFVRTSGGAGALLHRLADRVEVHVHGACVGAGIELPAFAGRILAAPGTLFRLPEVSMGLVPGAGGTVSIPRRIGRWRTLYLALTGTPLDTATALSWGLVDARR